MLYCPVWSDDDDSNRFQIVCEYEKLPLKEDGTR